MKADTRKPGTLQAGIKAEQGRGPCDTGDDSVRCRHEALLRGLDILREYHTFGLEQPSLSLPLKDLEAEAARRSRVGGQVRIDEALDRMAQELRDIDSIVDMHQERKSALIQVLLEVQSRYRWLPDTHLAWLSERLGAPWSEIYQIATFYKAFSLVPRGRHDVRVCLGTACYVRGGTRLLDRVVDALKIRPGETDGRQRFSLTTVNCLGCCALGPVMLVDGKHYGNPGLGQLEKTFAGCE